MLQFLTSWPVLLLWVAMVLMALALTRQSHLAQTVSLPMLPS
jgi:hypothetical protein